MQIRCVVLLAAALCCCNLQTHRPAANREERAVLAPSGALASDSRGRKEGLESGRTDLAVLRPETRRVQTDQSGTDLGVASEKPSKYSVTNHQIELVQEHGRCWLSHRAGNREAERLNLNLTPPCYVLTWQQPHGKTLDPDGISAGTPLGEVGDPVAWQYKTAKQAIVIAVIGDPILPEQFNDARYQQWLRQGYRCASTTRGVLFTTAGVRLSQEHFDGGLRCVETGMDELQYNILAHDLKVRK